MDDGLTLDGPYWMAKRSRTRLTIPRKPPKRDRVYTVRIPDELRERMVKYPDVDWGKIFASVVEATCDQLDDNCNTLVIHL